MTAFAAATAWAARAIVDYPEPTSQYCAVMAIPVFVCCGVGALRGRLRFWLHVGLCVDLAIVGLACLVLVYPITLIFVAAILIAAGVDEWRLRRRG